MRIYDGPLGRVDVVGAELYIGDEVVVSRPTNAQTRLSLGYIEKFNTETNFILIKLKNFKREYSWEKDYISTIFKPSKFYKVDNRNNE